MQDGSFQRPAYPAHASAHPLPAAQGQFPVGTRADGPAQGVATSHVDHCHQVGLALPFGVGQLREVCGEDLQRIRVEARAQVLAHEVQLALGPLQNLLYRRGAGLWYLSGQSQFMIAKKPSEPLMVNTLSSALLKLWEDPTVTVIRVVSYNRSNAGHQFLVFFAGASAFDPVVVGALRETDRLQALVQSVILFTLTGETNFLSR